VLGLGCENNQVAALKQAIEKERDLSRVHVYSAQVVDDEVNVGLRAAESLVPQLQTDERVPIDTAELMLAMKCGGSDGFSGITANPLVGSISDLVTAAGGTSILSEVPEMFGAEQYLLNRAIDKQVFSRLKGTIEAFKHYYSENGFPIYENPSPGNKDGGITTLEEKSLGAISKGGTAQITEVRKYGERVTAKGLAIVEAPGNDAVSCTAQVAAGAHMILFTTGRGTPLGFPVPTVKIATNSVLATRKQRWIDFDAGSVMHQSADWEAVTSEL
jgi:altronate hydrolase